MLTPPNIAPFAGVLADLATDLRRGSCCLVVCDKGWTLPLYIGLKERLHAADVRCGYLDGRVKDATANNEGGVMLAAVAQMRWAVRAAEAEGVVFAIPHLDVMTAVEGGWTSVSREVIPLLYENAATVWLGFQDPSLQLPHLVEKVFTRRYVIEEPYRTLETVRPSPTPRALPSEEALSAEPPVDTTTSSPIDPG